MIPELLRAHGLVSQRHLEIPAGNDNHPAHVQGFELHETTTILKLNCSSRSAKRTHARLDFDVKPNLVMTHRCFLDHASFVECFLEMAKVDITAMCRNL